MFQVSLLPTFSYKYLYFLLLTFSKRNYRLFLFWVITSQHHTTDFSAHHALADVVKQNEAKEGNKQRWEPHMALPSLPSACIF